MKASGTHYAVEEWYQAEGGVFKYNKTLHTCLLLQEAETVWHRHAWQFVDDAAKWHRVMKYTGETTNA
jgi:hypothetical protein